MNGNFARALHGEACPAQILSRKGTSMKRFLHRAMFLVPVTLALLLLGVPTHAVGLVDVRLTCSDGTDFELTLDAGTVNQLSDAVSGINLHPAGDPPLTCNLDLLTTSSSGLSTLPAAHAASNGAKDFAVGGGQIFIPFAGCDENFSISAHVPADTPAALPQAGAGGTANLSVSSSCPNPAWAGSVLVSKVDCVEVTGTKAEFTAEITKSTGIFFTSGYLEGTDIAFEVKDLNKTSLLADEIAGSPPGTTPCGFTANSSQTFFPVLRGNITVHDA
jgi:hypothetical protein